MTRTPKLKPHSKEALMNSRQTEDVVHFITKNASGTAPVTACGKPYAYPMHGNGWRVRDTSCPDCDRVICDLAHKHLNGE